MSDDCQDMSTPEARASYYEACWKRAAAAGNEARADLARERSAREEAVRERERFKKTWADMLNRAEAAEKERDEARAEVERLREALRVLAEAAGNECDGEFCGDRLDDLRDAVEAARAALGEKGSTKSAGGLHAVGTQQTAANPVSRSETTGEEER